MSQQASSVQADRSTIGALAAFLATGAAASLGLFPVLIMQESLGTDGLIGWVLGVILTGMVAGMTTKPLLHQARMAAVLIGGIVLPIALIFLGSASIGAVLLGMGLVGSAFVMPLVEWACGLSETGGVEKAAFFQFSSGRESSNPIPSTLVLGVLIFAWPGDWALDGLVAAPFFVFLLMLASLGGMFHRVRESSSGLVAVHPKFMSQWFLAGLLATLLCAGLGYVLPMMMGNINGVADKKLGGPVNEGPYATKIDKNNPNSQDKPNEQFNPYGLGSKRYQENLPAPALARSKYKTEDPKDKLISLLALAAIAAVALWVLKKYNRQVLSFLRWFWALISGPFVRTYKKIVDGARKKKHDAAVRAILAQIDDPFADPPAGMTSDDLRPLYDKLVADLALLGARPKADESALAFIRRVSAVYAVDKESLFYLGNVMTEAAFAPRPVSDSKLTNARERFLKVRKQVHGSVAPAQLADKQDAYRWQFAESKLEDKTAAKSS